MFCKKCGKEMADGRTFCPSCKAIVGNELFEVNDKDTGVVLHGNEEFDDDKKTIKIAVYVIFCIIGVILCAVDGSNVIVGGIISLVFGFLITRLIEWFQKNEMSQVRYKLPVTCSPEVFELEVQKVLGDYGYSAKKSVFGYMIVTKSTGVENVLLDVADIIGIDVNKSISAAGLFCDSENGVFRIIELPMNGLKRTSGMSAKKFYNTTIIVTCIIQRHFEGMINGQNK